MATPTDQENRKRIQESLKGLSSSEQEEVFRIVRRHQVPWTENSNGIFFDLNQVGDEPLLELQKYLQMCQDQLQDQSERQKALDNLSNEIKPLKKN